MKYQNYQLYCECQLVALWNAARFHGIKPPTPNTKQYHDSCEDAWCITGGCINITRECNRLNIKLIPIYGEIKLRWIRNNLPTHLTIFHKRKGFHSVLAVKVNRNKVLLANYTDNRLQWLPWKNLKKAMPRPPNNNVYTYKLRSTGDVRTI